MVVNKKLNFKWKTKAGQYQSGESLYLNKILVGSYSWNISRSRGSTESNHYAGSIFLPSLHFKNVYGEKSEEVKAKVEKVINAWFNEALRVK